MYELNFIRKRKRRLLVAIIGGVGTIGVATFSIAAFLGHNVGSFTVALESKNAELTLSEKSSFVDHTSFLRINQVPEFQEFTYRDFAKYGDEKIDSEDTDVTLGENENNKLNFLKYTFFIKNIGVDSAKYDLSLKIKENIASEDGRTLDDTVRVMVYDNGSPEVYAKRSTNYHLDENGERDYSAPISVEEKESTPEYPFEGYAKMFNSADEVMSKYSVEIGVGEVKKYTFVTWLEGFRSSNDVSAPKGASIKLGVEINAYEN